MSRKTVRNISALDVLEAEAMHIIREVASAFEKPALLFSGGKDSICLIHLARKCFAPTDVPFSLLHIDTGHNFPEALEFRDELVKKFNLQIIVRYVEDSIAKHNLQEEKTKFHSRNRLQINTLLDTIEDLGLDACIGGARRDEEKARAKERIFSIRDTFGQWEPRRQRPEIWDIYNTKIDQGENMRVFPLSNWTELDVWNYIKRENIEIPNLYFSHKRQVIHYQNQIFPVSEFVTIEKNDLIEEKTIRFRTIGDMTCTAAVESEATVIDDIIEELETSKYTERGARLDDKVSETAMEDRKKAGYF